MRPSCLRPSAALRATCRARSRAAPQVARSEAEGRRQQGRILLLTFLVRVYGPETYETGVPGHSKHIATLPDEFRTSHIDASDSMIAEHDVEVLLVIRVCSEGNRQAVQSAG